MTQTENRLQTGAKVPDLHPLLVFHVKFADIQKKISPITAFPQI